MNESDYWSQLEFRLTREFEGIEQCRRLGLWCDGFIPHSYDLAATRPCIHGVAWICPGQDQQKWRFTLVLDGSPDSRENIEWSKQLPPENVTRWMVLDFDRRFIEVEPGVAVPDASEHLKIRKE